MNKVKFTLFALAAIFAVSCVQDPVMEESVATDAKTNIAKKIINSSNHAASGKLMLFVDEETADAWATVTRSGGDALTAVANELEVNSLEPVFNMAINGEEKRAYNLHRWFVVKFDEEANLEAIAEKFAARADVKRVQYSTILTRPKLSVYPADEVAATRATDVMPFNDPMLELQWHYNNQGLKSIHKNSKEGEDVNAFAAASKEIPSCILMPSTESAL